MSNRIDPSQEPFARFIGQRTSAPASKSRALASKSAATRGWLGLGSLLRAIQLLSRHTLTTGTRRCHPHRALGRAGPHRLCARGAAPLAASATRVARLVASCRPAPSFTGKPPGGLAGCTRVVLRPPLRALDPCLLLAHESAVAPRRRGAVLRKGKAGDKERRRRRRRTRRTCGQA